MFFKEVLPYIQKGRVAYLDTILGRITAALVISDSGEKNMYEVIKGFATTIENGKYVIDENAIIPENLDVDKVHPQRVIEDRNFNYVKSIKTGLVKEIVFRMDGLLMSKPISINQYNDEHWALYPEDVLDTNTYISVNMVQARPMNREEALTKGLINIQQVADHHKPDDEGYVIQYKDGYNSWCPKKTFEDRHFRIEDTTKISKDDVDRFIVKGEGSKLGDKTCVVLDSTITGFDTIGTSACVDPDNYSQIIGEEIARKDIVNTIWGHLGFVLQWAKNGLNKNK